MTLPHRAAGFSLIELSVVLVLVALASAIVMPNLSAAYTRLDQRSELETLAINLSALPSQAYHTGSATRISTADDVRRVLELREAWYVEVIRPIVVNEYGVCLGGELMLMRDDMHYEIRVSAPYCRVEGE